MAAVWTTSGLPGDTADAPAGALMPSCVGQAANPKEAHRRLVNTFSLIEPLSTEGLRNMIKAELAEQKTRKTNGRSNGKQHKPINDHSMADAAG